MNLLKLYNSLNLRSGKFTGYFPVYETIFKDLKSKPIIFVEVGVMNGGSLELWKKFFHKESRIIGIDINPNALKLRDKGFEIFIGDQSQPKFWKEFYKKIGKINVLLDDGAHTNCCQIVTVVEAMKNIKDGGKVVIEDVGTSFMSSFGNPCRTSFINFAKSSINNLYARSLSANNKILNIFEKYCFSINFYDSIVAFEIDKKKCFKSKLKISGSKKIGATDQRFDHLEIFKNSNNFSQKLVNKLSRRIGIIYENYKLKKYFFKK